MDEGLRKPVNLRSPTYRKWVRVQWPCMVCSGSDEQAMAAYVWFKRGQPPVEAAHTGGSGLGSKSSDLRVVPLCKYHHQADGHGLDRIGPAAFEARYNVDLRETALTLINRFLVEGNVF